MRNVANAQDINMGQNSANNIRSDELGNVEMETQDVPGLVGHGNSGHIQPDALYSYCNKKQEEKNVKKQWWITPTPIPSKGRNPGVKIGASCSRTGQVVNTQLLLIVAEIEHNRKSTQQSVQGSEEIRPASNSGSFEKNSVATCSDKTDGKSDDCKDEYDSWEANPIDNDSLKKIFFSYNIVLQCRTNPESIVDEYRSARLEALNAKDRGDKKGQEQTGLIIRKLKHKIFALGLSDDILASPYVSSSCRASEDTSSECMPSEDFGSGAVTTSVIEGSAASTSTEFVAEVTVEDSSGSHSCSIENVSSSVRKNDEVDLEGKSGDVELGGFFIEDDASLR